MRFVALIPARGGSKRAPGKNTRLLAGHPLIAYTIAAALGSEVFDSVIVCTDDAAAARVATDLGVSVCDRDPVPDYQADIVWVRDVLGCIVTNAFAILRPTSPFRTAETIKRAHKQFIHDEAHSLRAVEPAKQHPGKMWFIPGPGYPMSPAIDARRPDGTPWHSSPTQTLPKFYVQNASLEMAWSYVVDSFGTISGKKVAPFFTEGLEGFDINTEEDWQEAADIAENVPWRLPEIHAHHSAI
jgi:CMP-N,N'-diacetyllegionaminic acid synthase